MTAALSTALVTMLTVFVFPGVAHAVLDQEQTSFVGGQQIRDGQSFGQTFTAGISGALHQIEIVGGSFEPSAVPLFVEIRNAQPDGMPGSSVLASASLLPADLPSDAIGWFTIPFNPPATVVAGTQYAIVLHSAAGNNVYGWYRTTIGTQDNYAGGRAWFGLGTPPTSWNFVLHSTDFAFRTYVGTPSVIVARPVSAIQSLLGLKVTFSATLSSGVTGAPIPGQPVSFAQGSAACSAVTAASGVATCSVPVLNVLNVLLGQPYTATFAGNATYLPASTTGASTL